MSIYLLPITYYLKNAKITFPLQILLSRERIGHEFFTSEKLQNQQPHPIP
ncbi:hypothetical protein [Aulosira sp. FACHB-615]|nr:hypothetical protein [Aulosira sp. FACHB-615]MBD2490359.1 hypothetical protein [Aulosira sp. FACHB-615]